MQKHKDCDNTNKVNILYLASKDYSNMKGSENKEVNLMEFLYQTSQILKIKDERIQAGINFDKTKCSFCNKEMVLSEEFEPEDNLSWKEYKLSGFCSDCQDAAFSIKTED